VGRRETEDVPVQVVSRSTQPLESWRQSPRFTGAVFQAGLRPGHQSSRGGISQQLGTFVSDVGDQECDLNRSPRTGPAAIWSATAAPTASCAARVTSSGSARSRCPSCSGWMFAPSTSTSATSTRRASWSKTRPSGVSGWFEPKEIARSLGKSPTTRSTPRRTSSLIGPMSAMADGGALSSHCNEPRYWDRGRPRPHQPRMRCAAPGQGARGPSGLNPPWRMATHSIRRADRAKGRHLAGGVAGLGDGGIAVRAVDRAITVAGALEAALIAGRVAHQAGRRVVLGRRRQSRCPAWERGGAELLRSIPVRAMKAACRCNPKNLPPFWSPSARP